jgi:multiple sugar transport system ATP-binding protein
MASVAYEHVSKRFAGDTPPAVNDLNLDVKDGEFMVLVGPSGSGKSTALRMLAGLEKQTDGNIRIGNQIVNEIPARNRDIAMVFQSYALYPHMTVYDNVAFGLRMRNFPKAEIDGKVQDAAKTLGISNLLARKPRQLSGGQRQRVALGRAIVRQPQCFLLDEPLSNLDAALRVETRINIQRLQQDLKATFVYVTHDQVEALTMGDRIAVLKEGVLQQAAPPRDVYDHPVNMYVAGFIGSPKMNFIPITVDGRTAKASGFTLDLPQPVQVAEGVLGVRPEDFAANGRADLPQVDMKVEVVESLGSEQFLHGKIGTDQITARVDPNVNVATGDVVKLGVVVRHVHVFDKRTERTLL